MLKVQSLPVGMLMTNCYIITDESSGLSAVIDPGELTPALDNILKKTGYETIKYIILTHGHYDHIGGTNDILKKTDFKAEVAVCKDDVPLLSDSYLNLSESFATFPIKPVKADIVFSDGDVIALGESSLKVMQTPGHTKGSVCLIGDGIIFSGDTLFKLSSGRTDFPTGSGSQLAESLKKLAELDGDYKIYPGHNDTTTLSYEKNNNPYIGRMNYDNIY